MSAKSFYMPLIAVATFLGVLTGCKENRHHKPTILPVKPPVVDSNTIVIPMVSTLETITIDTAILDNKKSTLSIAGTITKSDNAEYDDLVDEKVKLVFAFADTAGKILHDPDSRFNVETSDLKKKGELMTTYMDPKTRAYFISVIKAGKTGFPKGLQEMLDKNRSDSTTSKTYNEMRPVFYNGPIY